jgi:hypothetical protein
VPPPCSSPPLPPHTHTHSQALEKIEMSIRQTMTHVGDRSGDYKDGSKAVQVCVMVVSVVMCVCVWGGWDAVSMVGSESVCLRDAHAVAVTLPPPEGTV